MSAHKSYVFNAVSLDSFFSYIEYRKAVFNDYALRSEEFIVTEDLEILCGLVVGKIVCKLIKEDEDDDY